jgi:PPOX class probable F420-dependent enzyme
MKQGDKQLAQRQKKRVTEDRRLAIPLSAEADSPLERFLWILPPRNNSCVRTPARSSRAVLTTWRRDGRPQMSPITVGLDAAGRAIFSSRETAYKVRNLRRDPRASLCVFMEKFFGPWAQIDGTAEVVALPEAMEPLVDYYRRIAGEHPDWDDYRQAMIRDRRALIRITIEHAGPERQG